MASAKLSRTTTTPTSADIGTMSFWLKRSAIDVNNHYIVSNYVDSSNYGYIRFKAGDTLQIFSNSLNDEKRTSRLLRDTSAWYHIVLRVDTTQSTASDRVRLYINGVQETSFSPNSNGAQNADYDLFKAGATMEIGHRFTGTATYFDGQLAHFHYVDGQSYAPTVFGETDATTEIWKPKTDPGISQANYGNNGFFLKFDNSANMGLDSSGNSHNLTTSGTIIQTKDTPANVFCTLNPLDCDLVSGLSNGNNTFSGFNTGTDYSATSSTLSASSGKFYWEAKVTDLAEIDQVGIRLQNGVSMSIQGGNGSAGLQGTAYGGKGVQFSNGNKAGDGSQSAYMGGFSANDIIMVALDLDNNKITFGRNGQWADGSGNANQTYANSTAAFTNLTSGEFYCPAQTSRSYGSNSGTTQYNFGNGYFGTTIVSSAQNPDDGNGIFEYDPPSGFRALCTKSINAEEYS